MPFQARLSTASSPGHILSGAQPPPTGWKPLSCVSQGFCTNLSLRALGSPSRGHGWTDPDQTVNGFRASLQPQRWAHAPSAKALKTCRDCGTRPGKAPLPTRLPEASSESEICTQETYRGQRKQIWAGGEVKWACPHIRGSGLCLGSCSGLGRGAGPVPG